MGNYLITKKMNYDGVDLTVIMFDDQNEIMEFDTFEEADKIRKLFQVNSDSKHIYEVKKIGTKNNNILK
jgi:hypothetical protein